MLTIMREYYGNTGKVRVQDRRNERVMGWGLIKDLQKQLFKGYS